MKPTIYLSVAILALTLVLSGCWFGQSVGEKAGEKMMEKAIESQTGGKVDVNADNGSVKIKTEEGVSEYSAGGEAKIPDGLPAELIQADDAKIIMSSSAGTGKTVAYVTDTGQDALFDKYISELTGAGWKKDMELDMGDGKMLNFSKGDAKVTITIGKNDSEKKTGQTMANVMYGVEEK